MTIRLLERNVTRLTRPAICAAVLVSVAAAAGAAEAPVPREFVGNWAIAPERCNVKSDEPDTLTISRFGFNAVEIGCEVAWPEHLGDAFKFAARCYVGGADWSPAVVLLKRLSTDKISLSYLSLKNVGENPVVYYRCGR